MCLYICVLGSMPPFSTSLDQEGAQFVSFKIVDKGQFREKELIEEFQKPGRFPGCSGTRNLRDNLADLNAQIAANQKGILLLEELIQAYTLPVVQAYMGHIRSNAEIAVRQLLKDVSKNRAEIINVYLQVGKKTEKEKGSSTLHATDFMDDGTKIKLQVRIDTEAVRQNLHDF